VGPDGEEDKDLRLQNIVNKLKENADEAHIKEVSFTLVNKCQYSLTFILLTSFKIEIGERPAEKDHTEEIDRQRCESYS
jgi:hypothetical protein